MAFKIHRVTRYAYSIDGRTGTFASAQLFSADKQRLSVRCVADGAGVPGPTLGAELESATCYLRASAFPALLDLLRNEDPVSVTINDQSPGFVFIHTGIEPVGVGDEAASIGSGYMPT
jgi:hypothetical protein